MTTELRLITPEVAGVLLGNNVCNRKLRDPYVKVLASEMLSGRWRENTSETIKITKAGVLIDGQHRLHAVIRAKKSIRFLVASGLDAAIMDVIDSGIKRTSGDVLSLRGVKHAHLCSAIIRSYLLQSTSDNSSSKSGITNRLIEETYFQDSIFWDNVSVHAAKWGTQFRAIAGSYFGYCLAQILKNSNNTNKGIPFLNGLASGKDCKEIIIDLRNRLINNQISDRKLSNHAKITLIRAYWNAFVKDRKYKDDRTQEWL
jgi:hypothetical protein